MMTTQREKAYLTAFILFFLLLISFPVIYGFQNAGEELVFNGHIFNPLDNNSYLGKMRQGYEGSWLFTLDYTPNPGAGAFMFTFYIFLGHTARVLGLKLFAVLLTARLLSATGLLLVLYRVSSLIFDEPRPRWLAFTLTSLGSGSGWLFVSTGYITTDLWVAEAYPFLASFANPNFPLGLALQVWLLLPLINNQLDFKKGVKIFTASLGLAMISPFSIPVVLIILGGLIIWKWINRESLKTAIIQITLIGLSGAPLITYYYWISSTHPVLQGWNAQNLTLSPAWWDILVSFSPMILLAVPGAVRAYRSPRPITRILLTWAAICTIFVYVPFQLQRRFLIGLFIPITMLGVITLETWLKAAPRWKTLIASGVYLFTLITTLLSILTALFGITTQNDKLYLTIGEAHALEWIEQNTNPEAVILANSEMGSFIPAHTGRRVLYGHPFETVDAEFWEAAVDGFYAGGADLNFVTDNHVDYIFVGPREMELGNVDWLNLDDIVYQNDEVVIYATGE